MKKIIQPNLLARRQFLSNCAVLPLVGSVSVALNGCGTSAADNSSADRFSSYSLDRSIDSPNQQSRVRALILHYTAVPLSTALTLFSDPHTKVSAHYLIPDIPDAQRQFTVYQLVPETMMADHAGISYWRGERMLNAGSIGIELVNPGFPDADEDAPLMVRRWFPFSDAQIDVLGAVASAIVLRHAIPPYKVIGHCDVAPGRKFDPGPLFPWQRLHDQFGVGAWPDPDTVNFYARNQPYRGNTSQLQAKLADYGYDISESGELDSATTDVIAAFQMHFRPTRYDGVPDVETMAILDALLAKYLHIST